MSTVREKLSEKKFAYEQELKKTKHNRPYGITPQGLFSFIVKRSSYRRMILHIYLSRHEPGCEGLLES